MKKSEFDFSVPNRQSYVAIVMILFKTVNVVVRQLFPVLVVILVGGSKQKGDYIIWFIVAVSAFTMVYSIINFFRTYFIVQNGELVLHTGIFSRKKISIPFARIQTINFEQNIIHQFFSVLRIKVDTAGSEKNEFEFHALETAKAYALRDLVLAEKQTFVPNESEIASDHISKPAFAKIMSLHPYDLLKVGLTENHIKSGGLIFLFFFWIYQNLQEVGVDVDEYSEEIPEWEMGLYSILFFITILMVFSVIISLVRSVVSNYDLQFLRSNRGFKIVSGLFTKREVSALDHKIQHISWSDNLLKRWIGFKDLSLNQASSTELNAKQNIRIPGCKNFHINEVVSTLFGKTDFADFEMRGIDKKYFIRFALIVAILLLFAILGAFFLDQIDKIFPVVIVGVYFIVTRYISYRKKSFGHNHELLYIRGGVFGDKAEVLPIYKIQALELHQSPYQSRHQLCSITLYTASGRIQIPYIPWTIGKNISDAFIYKVESDKRRWM
jgi:putative membrane protein